MMILQFYFKSLNQTLIFVLNPCHITTTLWAILFLTDATRRGKVLFCVCMSWAFGCILGIVFAENDAMDYGLENNLYWVQHIVGAFIAPIVAVCSGRYPSKYYFNFKTVIACWPFFAVYMRYFLAPISAATWANLNHTLCSATTDPWRNFFNMGDYYYFWAEFYLCLPSVIFFYTNFWTARLFEGLIGGN